MKNILITGDEFAYLLDFGIAHADADPGLTQAGMTLGTYKYMAPERFSDHEVTYRSDIYSLACVLGECLTGAPPFHANSVERLVAAHLMDPAPRPSQKCLAISLAAWLYRWVRTWTLLSCPALENSL